MSTGWDQTTGMPMGLTGYGKPEQSYTSGKVGIAGPVTKTTTSTAEERTATSAIQASSAINTTPQALAALNNLIAELSDRPAITQEELDSKFPTATRQFFPQGGGGQWLFVDPRTGAVMDENSARQYNASQQAKRVEATRAAGVIKGGTETQKAQQAERQTEINRGRTTQDKYTKEAAMTDAQFLVNKSISDALEAAMPQISAGLDAAGTSRSTLAAALTQKAATKGAVEGAALGANLSSQYGQVNLGFANVLEELTRADPNSPDAMLLQAILGSKGLVTQGTTATAQSSVSNKTGTAIENTDAQVTAQTENKDYIPLSLPPLNQTTALSPKVQAATNPFYAFSNSTPDNSELRANYQGLYAPQAESLYSIEDNGDF